MISQALQEGVQKTENILSETSLLIACFVTQMTPWIRVRFDLLRAQHQFPSCSLSWAGRTLLLMLSSTSIFVPEMVSLCFWRTIDLWNLSTDSWVYRDRSTWGTTCIFLRLRRNKNQAMCKYKYSKSGKNYFWMKHPLKHSQMTESH